jgi:hypothetical protein
MPASPHTQRISADDTISQITFNEHTTNLLYTTSLLATPSRTTPTETRCPFPSDRTGGRNLYELSSFHRAQPHNNNTPLGAVTASRASGQRQTPLFLSWTSCDARSTGSKPKPLMEGGGPPPTYIIIIIEKPNCRTNRSLSLTHGRYTDRVLP